MLEPKMFAKMVAMFFVMITAVLLSLAVFDAVDLDTVGDNLGKLFAVSVIAVVATFVLSMIQRLK